MSPASCPSCKAEVRVDLSRVPAGRVARVACPTCHGTFTIGPAPEAAGAPQAASPGAALATMAGRDEAWLRREMEAMRAEIEKNVADQVVGRVLGALGKPVAHAEGEAGDDVRPALAIDSDPATAAFVAGVLGELGYAAKPCPDLKTAWKALDDDQRVVILGDSLADDAEGATKILDRLSRLPGAKRRRLFVAFVGTDVKTADGGLAFVLGATMTIHRGDLVRLKELLRRGMGERDKLYKPYFAALEALENQGT